MIKLPDDIIVPDILARHRVPGVALVRLDTPGMPDTPATPGCWLGGKPRLPAHIPWPTADLEGLSAPLPMHHMCQLDLSQLPKLEGFAGVPDKGHLMFFFEPIYIIEFTNFDSPKASRVIYVEEDLDDVPLRCPPPQPEIPEENRHRNNREAKGVFPYAPISAQVVDTYPVHHDIDTNEIRELDEIETEEYSEAYSFYWSKIDKSDKMEGYEKNALQQAGVFWLGANAKNDEFTRILYIQSNKIDNFKVGDEHSLGYKIEYYDLFMKNFNMAQSYFVNGSAS